MSRADRDFLLSCRSRLENFDQPDVVLLQTPLWGVEMPPYSQACLTSFARQAGYKVLPLDLNVECFQRRAGRYRDGWRASGNYWLWDSPEAAQSYVSEHRELFDRFADIVAGSGTRLVGFTVYFCSLYLSIQLARLIKRRDPDITVVFGGPQAARYLWPKKLLEVDCVDLTVHGEGELTLVDLLGRSRAGEELAGTPGTLTVVDGELVEGEPRPMIPRLDALPFADYSDYVFDCYTDPDVLPLATSRGFCGEIAFWPGYRALSGQRMYDEVLHQMSLYPRFNEIAFQDSLINGHLREIENFGRLLHENDVPIRWTGQAIMRKDLTYERLQRPKEVDITEEPAPSEETVLLTEIRDLLARERTQR